MTGSITKYAKLITDDYTVIVEVKKKNKHTFEGVVIQSDWSVYKVGYEGLLFKYDMFVDYLPNSVLAGKQKETLDSIKAAIDKHKTISSLIVTPEHYDNSKGTLYKVALERGWNPYLFEIVKRIERAEKKGEFISDIDKSIAVLQLYKKEQGHNFENQVEVLNK